VCLLQSLPAGACLELDDGVSIVRLWSEPPPETHRIKVWSGGRGLLVEVFSIDRKLGIAEFSLHRISDQDRVDPLFHLTTFDDLARCIQPALDMVSCQVALEAMVP
jgi:hypothetical protein